MIGGQAEVLMGGARITLDIDLRYRRSRANLLGLAEALRVLKPTLRGAPPDLLFRIDAEALALGCNYTFSTRFGNLDLLGFVEPLGDYDALAPGATMERVGKTEVKVIALDDLIQVKQHINRPKDRDSLMQLLAIKRIREESAGES